VTDTQVLSKLLFNAQHRIAVAQVFLVADEVLGHEDVAARAGVGRSVAHKELAVLVRIGAVTRLEASRQVFYERAASPFWAFISDLADRT
jgi:predicted transcriptional regulator